MLIALIHMLVGTVLAGVFVTTVVSVPFLYDLGMRTIPEAELAGFLSAFSVACFDTHAIKGSARAHTV